MNELDVNETRKRLSGALGDASKNYFAQLKSWFCMRISKEEFDRQARLLLPPNQIHLHNEFLLAVLTKCQSLCQPNSYTYPVRKRKPPVPLPPAQPTAPSANIKPVLVARVLAAKSKPLRVNFDNRFQAVDPASLLPAPPEERPLPPLAEKPVMRFCSRDLTMPDAALIHGRMLVAAWEAGLDQGCEDQAIELVLRAVRVFLRRLVVAVVADRRGYRLRQGRLIHSVGLPTLNPWLHNSWCAHDPVSRSSDSVTEVRSSGDPAHVPAVAPSVYQAERDSAFYVACSQGLDDTDADQQMRPISALDLFQTLQVKKSLIRCHTVYSVNMERISARLYHPDS